MGAAIGVVQCCIATPSVKGDVFLRSPRALAQPVAALRPKGKK